MAIYTVKYKLIDDDNRVANHQVLFDVADEATLLTDAAAHLADLQAMTDLGVVKYTYQREVAVNEAAGAGSNIDVGATFTWNSALVIDPTTNIPGIVASVRDGQGGIDLTATIVTDWAANYLSGSARLNANSPTQPTSLARGRLNK